jgi:hypothetical protein
MINNHNAFCCFGGSSGSCCIKPKIGVSPFVSPIFQIGLNWNVGEREGQFFCWSCCLSINRNVAKIITLANQPQGLLLFWGILSVPHHTQDQSFSICFPYFPNWLESECWGERGAIFLLELLLVDEQWNRLAKNLSLFQTDFCCGGTYTVILANSIIMFLLLLPHDSTYSADTVEFPPRPETAVAHAFPP